MIIKNCNVLVEDTCIRNAFIEIEGDRISKITTDAALINTADQEIIDASGGYASPGFIDSHTHGGFGFDYSDLTLEDLETVLANLPKFGTTGVLPTIGSTSMEDLTNVVTIVKNNLERIQKSGTKFLGFHLEGPFLNPARKGAQAEQFIIKPDLKQLRDVVEFSEGLISLVTIAPELDNAFELITYLVSAGITVNVGHSEASYETTIRSFDAGAKRVTHLFNCMAPLHHRNPGMVGAALTRDDIYTELVLDGYHIDPVVANIIYRIKGPDRVILITDSTHLVGLPEGEYTRPGGRPVIFKDGAVRMPSGILAGSVLTLDKAYKNAIDMLGIKPFMAAKLTSTNAARSLGLDDIGSIREGNKADIVLLDEVYQVKKTIINGEVRYEQ